MKVKVLHVLAVLAVLGLAVTVAHAGHGQGGPEVAVFDCYSINGANSDRVVTLTDQFGIQQNVHINGGKLVCTVATMTKLEGDPDFDNVPGDQDHLKCYQVAIPGPRNATPPNPPLTVRVFDPVIGGLNTETDGEAVSVLQGRYVCTFATKIVPTP
jgi:hypothetical protein